MKAQALNRRDMIKASVATAALAFAQYPLSMFGGPEVDEGVLIPFLDPQPNVKRQTRWPELTSWRTKSEDLYVVTHYNVPTLKAEGHTLEISGLVRKGRTLTLDDIKKRKRKTITATDSAHEKLAGCAQLKLATSRGASLGGDRGAMR